MARRRDDPNRTSDSGKPDLSPEIRARLSQAERYAQRVAARRQREREALEQVAQDFAKIRDQVPVSTPSQKMRDAVARYSPPLELKGAALAKSLPVAPPPAWKPMSGKTWLDGNTANGIKPGLDRFPRQPGESVVAWAKRLSVAASAEGVLIKPGSVRAHINAL